MRSKLYVTSAPLDNSSLASVLALMESLDWPPPVVEVGVERVMRLARGRANPSCGFVLVMPDDAVVRDTFELVEWIDKNGLRPL